MRMNEGLGLSRAAVLGAALLLPLWLACPGCGGRLRLLATIADPMVIARILRHLGLPVEVPVPAPARQPASWASDSTPASRSTARTG